MSSWVTGMKRIGLIPRNRLQNIPEKVRLCHELCFFLHDESTRALVECEQAGAHLETIQFKHQAEFERFEELCNHTDPIGALRELGYANASKKVVLNTISIAMISDCLHHVYEALQCFEKRKCVVGFNLLRKPLVENLLYLSWMYGDPDEFYLQFTKGDPNILTLSTLGTERKQIYLKTIKNLEHCYLFDSGYIEDAINNKGNENGFQKFFQHAAHLVTTWKAELRTASENFNFIFKNSFDDDIYDLIYQNLPYLLLFMSHLIIGIFNRMEAMDETSKHLFHIRTMLSYDLITEPDKRLALSNFKQLLSTSPSCSKCSAKCKITLYNAISMLLMSRFRCTCCRTSEPFLLFSYPEYQQSTV